jgi:hypothetical protein
MDRNERFLRQVDVGAELTLAGNKLANPEVTKRCRLFLLTNSALVYELKCGGRGGVAESRPMRTAVHMEPK